MEKSVQIILPFLPVVIAMGIVAGLFAAGALHTSIKARRDGRHWLTGKPL